MKKTYLAAILILGAFFLGGCAERGNSYAPGAELDSSLDSAGSDVSNNSSSTESSLISSNSLTESTDVSNQPISVEFTDEDRELQKILSELKEPANEIYSWLTNYDPGNPNFKFRFPNDETEIHYYSPFLNIFSNRFEIPKTYSEMENLMLEFFSADRTKIFLSKFAICSAVENSDGTYTLRSEDEQPLSPKKFVEIDGKLYRDAGILPIDISIDLDTVRVNYKTDDIIEFTYLDNDWTREVDNSTCLNDITLYLKYSFNGTLKYERDGWKIDDWGIS